MGGHDDKLEERVRRYVIGNWKCQKGIRDARTWLTEFAARYRPVEGVTVILAPTFLCLPDLALQVADLGLENVKLAAQNVSSYPRGSYTGEVAADMLNGLASYVILGHSERRRYMHETALDVAAKLHEAVEAGLAPVVCLEQPLVLSDLLALRDIESPEMILAYGPTDATMARVPEVVGKVAKSARKIQEGCPGRPIVYGGALEAHNAFEYARLPELSGLFVGEASLKVDFFLAICEQVGRSEA